MANPEHLKILKQGISIWNPWRRKNVEIRPDLSNADLSGANFSGADLTFVDFSAASLRRAHLADADLSNAILLNANLEWAFLTNAILRGTDLRGAILSNAYLGGTTILKANLKGTILSKAFMGSTFLLDLDLSEINGFDDIIYFGPSPISTSTLYNSKARIPDHFLRGCGIPENLIQYLPSLVAHPIEFYSCFISYSHKDKSFARRLHDTIQGRGIRCWLDEKKLLPGDDIYEHVDRGIRLWDKVLLCCSENSLKSWWVDNEITTAFEKEQKLMSERGSKVLALIPLDLDDYLFSDKCKLAYRQQITRRLSANFKGWENDNSIFEREVENVIKALRTDREAFDSPPPSLL